MQSFKLHRLGSAFILLLVLQSAAVSQSGSMIYSGGGEPADYRNGKSRSGADVDKLTILNSPLPASVIISINSNGGMMKNCESPHSHVHPENFASAGPSGLYDPFSGYKTWQRPGFSENLDLAVSGSISICFYGVSGYYHGILKDLCSYLAGYFGFKIESESGLIFRPEVGIMLSSREAINHYTGGEFSESYLIEKLTPAFRLTLEIPLDYAQP